MAQTMKAAVLPRFGGPDVFEMKDVPLPQPGARQVRVRIHATALNPLDLQMRRGDYAALLPLPAIIGHDVSGVVDATGADVDDFTAGDEVWYTPKIFGGPGSYAEYQVVDAEIIGRKPANLSHREAASLTLVGGTVWEAFVTRAQLVVGETVLIHAGAGGVGSVAIQLAKAMGARVLTTARAHHHDFVTALGADAAIDHTQEDYADAALRLTNGRGVDVLFDTIGGDALSRAPFALAPLGRVVSIVDIARPQNLLEAWSRNASYHFLFTRQNRAKLDGIGALVERGLIKAVIGATLPLDRITQAHELLENGSARGLRGKVVIDITG
ncbi:MAG TPA: zinc-dependent alcohol dehydrogenase family protein [Bosea sp. (in: a-proteobacteria)]|jgi:NADPH:quinone reductase-like Zn-dependent oxidoreductase|nr:zinc-dependent alcohol dehydrogenase family protein [Bosea sp. (in: a-proteobacteria)]